MTKKNYRIYLRISKNGIVKASRKPKFEALCSGGGQYSTIKYYPTIQIALDLKIDEKEFEATRILLETEINNSIPCVKIEEKKQK